jgi:hypothetical protein
MEQTRTFKEAVERIFTGEPQEFLHLSGNEQRDIATAYFAGEGYDPDFVTWFFPDPAGGIREKQKERSMQREYRNLMEAFNLEIRVLIAEEQDRDYERAMSKRNPLAGEPFASEAEEHRFFDNKNR